MIPQSCPGGVLLVQNKGIRAWAKMCPVDRSLWTLQTLCIFPNGTHRSSAWGCCPSTPKFLDLSTLQFSAALLSSGKGTDDIPCCQVCRSLSQCPAEVSGNWHLWDVLRSDCIELSLFPQHSVSQPHDSFQFQQGKTKTLSSEDSSGQQIRGKKKKINIYMCE